MGSGDEVDIRATGVGDLLVSTQRADVLASLDEEALGSGSPDASGAVLARSGQVAAVRGEDDAVHIAERVILPRFRGQSHYAAIAAVCDLNSNSIGLT